MRVGRKLSACTGHSVTVSGSEDGSPGGGVRYLEQPGMRSAAQFVALFRVRFSGLACAGVRFEKLDARIMSEAMVASKWLGLVGFLGPPGVP